MAAPRPARLSNLLLLLAATMPVREALHAQVGHDPNRSPYRNIVQGASLIASYGTFGGSGGRIGVGPHDGTAYGFRARFLGDKTISLLTGFSYGMAERDLINPDKAPDQQYRGTIDQNVLSVDFAVLFNLTGGKTWRGFAPYAGGGFGVAFTEDVEDTEGNYRTGNKFTLSPLIGTRFFITNRVYLSLEARFQFWQLSYPEDFRQEPSEAPGTEDNPNAVLPDGRLKEWSAAPILQIGLGFPWPRFF